MTVQLKDSIKWYNGNEGSIELHILNVESGILIDLSKYGITPSDKLQMSACYKGYTATYTLDNSVLTLKDLRINTDPDKVITINNIEPIRNKTIFDLVYEEVTTGKISTPDEESKASFFNTTYKDLNIILSDFTGVILVGKVKKNDGRPIYDTTDNMDYWKKVYKKITRVEFVDGKIVNFNSL